jgi:adenine-specific DNA-methyltransferase
VGTAPLTFAKFDIESILEKIARKRNFELDGDKEVAQGIVAPQDFVNSAAKARLGEKFRVGDGIFCLGTNEKRALDLTSEEQSIIRPFFTTRELGRYFGSKANKLWVIYTDSRFKKRGAMAPYPNIKRHLDQFKKVITSHNRPYGLHRARDERFFVGEKIISLRKCIEPCFTYTEFPCYVSQTHNVIKTSRINQSYLAALLNSRLVRFWLKHKGKMQGKHFQVDKEPLLAIPLYVPVDSEQMEIAKLVERIIECGLHLSKTRSSAEQEQLYRLIAQWDEEIQNRIEGLYGLSDGEKSTISEEASNLVRNAHNAQGSLI